MTHVYSRIVVNILDYKESLPKGDIPLDIAQILKYFTHIINKSNENARFR